ncbi:AAA family ATPase [Candidatus Woesearchaeota archaeon]|jgi:MinD-like ATPase involved in chromosome partitioning or flagellar assembly|nr:AAA family ATPase [Candidatus Woesearchaeota archaeon]MBT4367951.1 AAA family ATPase [Candidatus Woesearchaeota archaeon]MBT4712439.1 AAA family ATPase [Candidatus Woesearchaeota archaeon]MBT6639352.1 AAA family ATPase [Candidatus Woesearchaeota archaeon]MBT7133524.1 AAA family ATPase [Candidatus Woesearchaeota archaeon]
MSKIISVVSFKGGVGKTTTALNLGSALSKDLNKKVLIVDSNFSSPSVGLHFGIINPDNTFQDILKGKTSTNNAVYKINTGLYILPSAVLSKKVNMFTLKHKLNELRQFYDYVILDTSPSLNSSTTSAISASDEVLIVSNADYLGLSSTLKAISLINQKRIPIKGIVLNNISKKSSELTKEDIENATKIRVISTIPTSPQFSKAIVNTSSVVFHNPKSCITKLYTNLAAKITETNLKKDPFKHRIRQLFKKKITQEDVKKLLIENEIQ